MSKCEKCYHKDFCCARYSGPGCESCLSFVDKASIINVSEAIPIEVLKQELIGCQLAIQCDMGGRYEYELISTIRSILKWIDTPRYEERLSRCKK